MALQSIGAAMYAICRNIFTFIRFKKPTHKSDHKYT
ncbi:hypothetical protein C8N40_11639 [Pontibacter mucosus]|uniref:Uncharacterized protein n=1 Tax=Pontibacter mucosus TaxID=1649266 RepID=A0A2T5Y3E4_9BACT|nr:hypothetical protein C8N40_11639 [Pontibacter mucosus]